MQALLAAPRAGLTDAQVRAIVTSNVLDVTPGLEVRDSDGAAWVDRSDVLVSGTVTRDSYATGPHADCSLQIGAKLAWGKVQVRPYMILSDGINSAQINAGVFLLTTPLLRVTGEPDADVVYDVSGMDLRYKLDRPVGDNYEVLAGVSYAKAVQDALVAAGITDTPNLSQVTGTLPANRSWLLIPENGGIGDTTWLEIINDLLKATNHGEVWFDENGTPRTDPDTDAATEPVTWTFDADDARTTLVGQERASEADTYDVPNAWIFVAKADLVAEGSGIYRDTTSNTGLTSFENLGYRRFRVREIEAANQDALVAEGKRLIAEDLRVAHTITITTSPFPLAGHRDRYTYLDRSISPFPLQVKARNFTLDLLGGDMTHTFEVIA